MTPEPLAATSHSEEARPSFVVGAGLLLGASALALSVTGILWCINRFSVAACLVAATLVVGLWAWRSRPRCGTPIWTFALLLPLLVLQAIVAMAPPHEWDEVAYGAALPKDYTAVGRFFYNADYGPYSAFPANYEALVTASLVLAGEVTPVHLLNVILALGLAVIAAHLSRRLGAGRLAALCAAVLVLSAEALVTIMPITKNDVANAFFQSLALLAIAAYVARRELSWLALGGFFLGTALGVKYSSLEFALCVTPLTAALVLAGPGHLSRRLRDLAVFGALALAAALPWYARNYVAFQNPFFPFLNELLRAHNGFTPEHSAITHEMFSGWSGYSWHTGTLRGFLREVHRGFGWVPALLSVPGLLVAAWRRRGAPCAFLGAALVSFGLVTLFMGYWLPRYYLSLLVLASAFAAVAVAEILRAAGSALGRYAPVALAALLVLAVGGRSLESQWTENRRLIRDVLHLKTRGERFLRARVTFWGVADWANRNVGPGQKIGLCCAQPFYYLNRPYFHIHPMTEKGNLQALETPEQFLQAFHDLGLTWLAFAPCVDLERYPESTAPRENAFIGRLDRARRALVQNGKLTFVAAFPDVHIYRVETPAHGGGSR